MLSSILTLSLAGLAFADPHGHARVHRHQGLAKRAQADVQLFKRFDNARFTFYDVGLGACGKYNQPGDFIVALNSAQYGGGYPGPNCFKQISISYGGKTTTATIMDECPGCPYGGLDFSRGLFDFFASEDKGVLYGEWHFTDGSGGGGDSKPDPKPAPPPKPKTTHHTTTTHEAPKTTYQPPPPPKTTSSKKPSSTYVPPPSTSHPSSSSAPASKSASPSINYSSGAASGMAVPTGSPSTSYKAGGLQQFNVAMINIGGLINAAGHMQN